MLANQFLNIELKGGLITMAHVINDGCLMCGACADTCPVGAISSGDDKYTIDADTCIDCGACEAGCPAGVIAAE